MDGAGAGWNCVPHLLGYWPSLKGNQAVTSNPLLRYAR